MTLDVLGLSIGPLASLDLQCQSSRGLLPSPQTFLSCQQNAVLRQLGRGLLSVPGFSSDDDLLVTCSTTEH